MTGSAAELSQRADEQNRAVLQGNPAGVFGEYMPSDLAAAFSVILSDDPPFDETRYEDEDGSCADPEPDVEPEPQPEPEPESDPERTPEPEPEPEPPTTGTCVSCGVPAACTKPWPTDLVPLPPNIVDGLICDDCHAALVRFAELMG